MKISKICTILCFLMPFVFASCSAESKKSGIEEPAFSFATGSSPAYHISLATVEKNGRRVIITAGYDGTVQCHRMDGKLAWETQTGGSFPNDLLVTDINDDGLDESLIASTDGSLYVINNKGKLLWKFSRDPQLMTVCVLGTEKGKVILTGGVERVIYALDINGEIIGSRTVDHLIKMIRKGDLSGTGKDYASVLYARRSRGAGQYLLQLIDSETLVPVWQKDLNISMKNPLECYFDMLSADVDKDGDEDVVLSHGWRDLGKLSAYNFQGELVNLPEYKAKGITKPTYRMNRIVHVKSTGTGEYLLGLFGNQLIRYNMDLTMDSIFTTFLSYANSTFDPVTSTYLIGGSICGDDCIHVIDLQNDKWPEAYEKLQPEGKLAQVLRNIEKLNSDIDKFVRPGYQPEPVNVDILGNKPAGGDDVSLANLSFFDVFSFHENYDRSSLPGIWKTKKEIRFQYNDTQKEIFDIVKEREEKGLPFASWGGHGNDPFYMQLSTLEGILSRAPETFKAFVFPEMESTSQDMVEAVNAHLIPLAKLCKKYGKYIIMRSKNIYWLGNCYVDLWKNVLFNPEYGSVFIPGMEETNSRCQDLSLSGRTGLWLTGYFDRVSSRSVTDNACYHRIWEWSSQQIYSHFIRALALGTSLGSDMLLVDNSQGDPDQMLTLYKMLDKGVIFVPKRDDVLSVSDFCLGIRTPSPRYLAHGTNGHDFCSYEPEEGQYVFDRLDVYWGGAPVKPYDFSYYGTGSRSRMLDFLPKNPYGLVAFVPDEINLADHPRFKTKISTDGEFFYDAQGNPHSAGEYRPVVEKQLQEAAERLPVIVEGDVSWTTVRIDKNHIRLIAIDPGYIDPSERSAIVKLQNISSTECRDILSNETIPVSGNSFKLTIPAGIFRIIDITHK